MNFRACPGEDPLKSNGFLTFQITSTYCNLPIGSTGSDYRLYLSLQAGRSTKPRHELLRRCASAALRIPLAVRGYRRPSSRKSRSQHESQIPSFGIVFIVTSSRESKGFYPWSPPHPWKLSCRCTYQSPIP